MTLTVLPIFNLRERVITQFGPGAIVEIRRALHDDVGRVYFVQHDFGGPASGFYCAELRREPTV